MSELIEPSEISEEDYRAIEEAVMETARGRWFLAEYAKRNRVSETSKVLSAIESLKSYISREHEPADVLQMRLDIVDMTQTIEHIKREIANMGEEGGAEEFDDAKVQLNAVVDETEQATSNILAAAEAIQEIAWEMRDAGQREEECEKLDALATEIYTACSFQDLTGQRLRKVVQVSSMIEERLRAMVAMWGSDDIANYRDAKSTSREETFLLNGPALPGNEKGQDDIDAMMAEDISVPDPDQMFQVGWSDSDDDEVSSEDNDDQMKDAETFVIEDDYETIDLDHLAPETFERDLLIDDEKPVAFASNAGSIAETAPTAATIADEDVAPPIETVVVEGEAPGLDSATDDGFQGEAMALSQRAALFR